MNATIDIRVNCPIIDLRTATSARETAGRRISIQAANYRYAGEFCPASFAAHGRGTLYLMTEVATYKGDFRMGRIEGFGRFTSPDVVYEGYYVAGRAHGIGRATTSAYEIKGCWADGHPDGQCTIHDRDIDVFYTAVYHHGRQIQIHLARGADRIRATTRVTTRRAKKRARRATHHNVARNVHQERQCAICMERAKQYTATPCGHFYACQSCRSNRCAICRQPVLEWVRVFG